MRSKERRGEGREEEKKDELYEEKNIYGKKGREKSR